MLDVFSRLADSGCEALTIGQYIAPSRSSLPVQDYVPPAAFDELRAAALKAGFRWVKAGPFVRSSYQEEKLVFAEREAFKTGGRTRNGSKRVEC